MFITPRSNTTNSASILERIKEGYLAWVSISIHMEKHARHTIGTRIEKLFLDLLEIAYKAYFSPKEQKVTYINKSIQLLDIIKFLTHTAWQGKMISHKHYETLIEKYIEIGKMLGGWKKGIEQKTPAH